MAKREWFTVDFGWKFFSVILAVAVWLTVYKIREEPESSATTGVPNTYGDLPVLVVSATADARDFQVVPGTVSVTVSGSQEVMAVLQANQIRPFVDLTDIGSTKDLRRKVEVAAPPGVTLVGVDPPKVTVIIPAKK
jgi:YbbR domain-containing protein